MKATTANRIACKAEIQPILSKIKDNAVHGKFCLYVPKLTQTAVNSLKTLGYSITLGDSGTCHYIEWFDVK